MGFLAVQEDGKVVCGCQHSPACGLGKDRGVRQASARHWACGGTAESPARTGDDQSRFRRVPGERPPAEVSRECRIPESARVEVQCCALVDLRLRSQGLVHPTEQWKWAFRIFDLLL